MIWRWNIYNCRFSSFPNHEKLVEAIFGECLNYKSGLRILIWPLEVPFFWSQRWPLLAKVTVFGPQFNSSVEGPCRTMCDSAKRSNAGSELLITAAVPKKLSLQLIRKCVSLREGARNEKMHKSQILILIVCLSFYSEMSEQKLSKY